MFRQLSTLALTSVTAIGMLNSTSVRAEDPAGSVATAPITVSNQTLHVSPPVVQIAILLDNSGSMRGLIDQARSELWKVVNQFIGARIDGQRPRLEVAVYHYGRPPATQLVPLTDDLDRVSESLFGIPVSGGSEYCGAVIQSATEQLDWNGSSDDLRLIFIAGNEPFTQGPVDFRQACKAAIEKGIVINTIHCGPGIPDGWRDGALLADGKSMHIDHNQAVIHFEAPQDAEIARLGVALNKTYIAYGAQGTEAAHNQALQDQNASTSSLASATQRAVTKASGLYRNSAWDLCDAMKEGHVDLSKISEDDLPEDMRSMSHDERVAYVKKMQADRETIQQQIHQLNSARQEFVSAKRKELAEQTGTDTLDTALIGAIREQAMKRKYTFAE